MIGPHYKTCPAKPRSVTLSPLGKDDNNWDSTREQHQGRERIRHIEALSDALQCSGIKAEISKE